MHGLQIRQTRTHLPTAAQPLARSQMPPYFRLVRRDGFRQSHRRGYNVKILMGGRHKFLPTGSKLFDFQLPHKPVGAQMGSRRTHFACPQITRIALISKMKNKAFIAHFFH